MECLPFNRTSKRLKGNRGFCTSKLIIHANHLIMKHLPTGLCLILSVSFVIYVHLCSFSLKLNHGHYMKSVFSNKLLNELVERCNNVHACYPLHVLWCVD